MAVDRVRLPDGDVVIFDEWLHWPVFSTVEWSASSAVRLRAFSYVVGQKVPSRGLASRQSTPADTNQIAKSRMNWDEAFRVFSMTYEAFGLSDAEIEDGNDGSILVSPGPMLSATNLRRLQRDVLITLKVGVDIEKGQVHAPFSYFHQGIGPVYQGSGDSSDAAQAIQAGTGGDVSPSSQRRYAFPIKIGEDRTMQLLIATGPTGAIEGLDQDVRLRWYLDGVKRRPAMG